MTYDFDIPTERHGTDCLKFDRAEKRGRSADLLSLWVADMDFPTAPEIVDAIIERTKHGIFGYTEPGAEYFAALDNWLAQRYGWHVTEDEVTVAPGVVYALAMAVRAFTEPGDAVIIQQPVYYPFSFVVTENERTLVNAQLAYDGKRYHIDFEELERLEQLGKICLRHGVVVVSDEIHMDFARPGIEHVPFATLNEQFAQNCVACTSASKTFNLAGLQVANIVIPNKDLRRAFRDEVISSGYSQPNTLGMVATQAAYEHGGSWLDQLKDYLEGNWQLLGEMLEDRTPELQLIEAESTYLAWIDCRALGLDAWQLERFIEDEAKLWLDCGHIFGAGGDGFIRINIATQRSYLERAIDQLASAVEKRRTNL